MVTSLAHTVNWLQTGLNLVSKTAAIPAPWANLVYLVSNLYICGGAVAQW